MYWRQKSFAVKEKQLNRNLAGNNRIRQLHVNLLNTQIFHPPNYLLYNMKNFASRK